ARQLASRGRRRVQGMPEDGRAADVARQRDIVEAFFRASRAGDFQALLAVLDPGVALRGDETALRMGVRSGWLTSELHGARAVAEQFAGRAETAQLAMIDGVPGVVWVHKGRPRVVFGFTMEGSKITGIDLLGDPEHLGRLTIELLA